MTLATITLPDGTGIDYRDDGTWSSNDPAAADLAASTARTLPPAYRPDPVLDLALAVAADLGGEVTFAIPSEQPDDRAGPQ